MNKKVNKPDDIFLRNGFMPADELLHQINSMMGQIKSKVGKSCISKTSIEDKPVMSKKYAVILMTMLEDLKTLNKNIKNVDITVDKKDVFEFLKKNNDDNWPNKSNTKHYYISFTDKWYAVCDKNTKTGDLIRADISRIYFDKNKVYRVSTDNVIGTKAQKAYKTWAFESAVFDE